MEELTAAIAESPMVFRIATDRTTAEGCFDLSTVSKVEDVTEGVLDIHASVPEQSHVDGIVDALRSNGVSLLSMKRRNLTLEEAFLQIVRESE